MNYRDRFHDLESASAASNALEFIKMGEAREDREGRGRALRDLGLVGAGTAIGGGVGYGLAAMLRKRYGATIDGVSPDTRIKYLAPAVAATGGAAALINVLRQRAEARSRRSKNDNRG